MSYTEQLIAEAMCDEIKELKAENKKLKEENKALKEVEEENKDIKEKITKLKQDMLEMLEAEDSSSDEELWTEYEADKVENKKLIGQIGEFADYMANHEADIFKKITGESPEDYDVKPEEKEEDPSIITCMDCGAKASLDGKDVTGVGVGHDAQFCENCEPEEKGPDCCEGCDTEFDLTYTMNHCDPAVRKKYEAYFGSPDDDGDMCAECMDKNY
tara:strand:+ start:381 stop:1025 length:645 start_codon:yes stop_codon:yes gene_type:complete